MGARKRLQSKDRKAQKHQQKSRGRASSPSSSSIQAAAAALLRWESSSSAKKRSSRLSYALLAVVVALALPVLLLCAVCSSKLMRMEGGAHGHIMQPWVASARLGAQRLGMGVAGAVGLTWEDPVETRRRRQVLEDMRLNNVPMQLHPETVAKTPEHTRRRRGPWWSRIRSEADAEERRRLEEAEALAAMAQRRVLLLNGREPDSMSGQCLEKRRGRSARSRQQLAYALSGGSGSGLVG